MRGCLFLFVLWCMDGWMIEGWTQTGCKRCTVTVVGGPSDSNKRFPDNVGEITYLLSLKHVLYQCVSVDISLNCPDTLRMGPFLMKG